MSQAKTRKLLLLGFSGALFISPAVACGPFFPNQLLFNSGQELTWAPVADFRHEIDRIARPAAAFRALPPKRNSDVFAQSAEADIEDLRAALDGMHTADNQKTLILDTYKDVRSAESKQAADSAERRMLKQPPVPQPPIAVPDGLPREFELYFRGVIAFHSGQMDEARAQWEKLLQLPVDQRQFRTVRAQFMIGKSYLDLGNNPTKAIAAFQAVRDSVTHGARDTLGLASASLGLEALAELDRDHVARAMELYLDQHASGDPTAVPSLAIVCESVFGEKDTRVLRSYAADPLAARVLTGYAISSQLMYHAQPTAGAMKIWLKAVESSGVGQVIGADRLAMAAYQAGNMALAQRWLDKALPDAPMGLWLKAKLLLRAGKVDAAAEVLARASRSFPESERWWGVSGVYEARQNEDTGLSPRDRAAAELGALQLARGQYVDALDHLSKSGWWLDAAYIAERVLTEDEVIAYVDHNCPEGVHPELRHLLARRLTRAGRWKEARPYFPEKLRPRLDAYITAIREGHKNQRSAAARAESFWTAATIARSEGMDLMATELSPDDFTDSGLFTGSSVPEARQESKDTLLPPTPDEVSRVVKSATKPFKRWHYRYIAADHAWEAIELMSDESDLLASRLCEAGGWLKAQDPKAANRFYKALVTRCGTTALGRAAAQKKWFPDVKH